MAQNAANKHTTPSVFEKISQFLPIVGTLKTYRRDMLSGDILAGLIVAIMLIPQGMAYALLAGLPPQVGLYASILPLILYGMLGTSRHLAVGPVAIVSLLTASSIGLLAAEGTPQYMQFAITLALMVAIIQTGMGLLRAGFLVNFLSHPVLVGFSAAAAIVIGFSQMKSLLGIAVSRHHYFYQNVAEVVAKLGETNFVTLSIGVLGILTLLFFKKSLGKIVLKIGLSRQLATVITKSGPLFIVLMGTLAVRMFHLNESAGIKIVGDVPSGLPTFTLPSFQFEHWKMLIATALAISFVGYMESISVAKSLASKRKLKIDANQELIALGVANFGAAFSGGYPVTGGFSRSLVNFEAGARSTLASIITAILIALSIVFITPLFYYIPKAVLASIIMVAVTGLFDLPAFKRIWVYNKRDAAALLITFFAVLTIGIENGVLVGAGASLVMFIARTSNPHAALVGRLPNSDFYRNVKRYDVQTWPELALLRIDASLYFANSGMVANTFNEALARKPEMKDLVLIGTAINDIDYSALEMLESMFETLEDAGIELHLAGFKGPVLDKLAKSKFMQKLGSQHIHLSTHDAVVALGYDCEEQNTSTLSTNS